MANIKLVHSPSAVFRDNMISCFYQAPDSHQLCVNTFDGTRWFPTTPILNVMVLNKPSAIFFKGKFYVFYQSYNDPGWLYYCVWNGATWSERKVEPAIALSSDPNVVAYNGKLFLTYERKENDQGWLWFCMFDEANWTPSTKVTTVDGGHVGITETPSAVFYPHFYPSERLLVFHQGQSYDGWLWFTAFDGKTGTWSTDLKLVLDTGISSSPSAWYYGLYIQILHQGRGNSTWLWCRVFDGRQWPTSNNRDYQIEPWTGITESPSVVEWLGRGLYVFHQGQHNSGTLWYNFYDGNRWVGDKEALLR